MKKILFRIFQNQFQLFFSLDFFPKTTTPEPTQPIQTTAATTVDDTTDVEIAEVTTGQRDQMNGAGLPTCDKTRIPQFVQVSCVPDITSHGRYLIETECTYSCAQGKTKVFENV